jgi:transcriptional repressor NrdR
MKCPFCGVDSDKVIDSRSAQEGRAVRRRRECQDCGKRFTTYEYIEKAQLTVIKTDEAREPYVRQKLIRGLKAATTKRPVSAEQIETLVEELETELFSLGKSEVSSQVIGEMVMDRLRHLDEVSYVRFASVYRKFEDATEFADEIKKLK